MVDTKEPGSAIDLPNQVLPYPSFVFNDYNIDRRLGPVVLVWWPDHGALSLPSENTTLSVTDVPWPGALCTSSIPAIAFNRFRIFFKPFLVGMVLSGQNPRPLSQICTVSWLEVKSSPNLIWRAVACLTALLSASLTTMYRLCRTSAATGNAGSFNGTSKVYAIPVCRRKSSVKYTK